MSRDTKTGEARRIFDAAVKLIARRGSATVTMKEVAAAARVPLAEVTRYYPDRLDLWKAILEEYGNTYYAATLIEPAPGRPPEEHVRAVVRSMVDFFRRNIELALAADAVSNEDVPELHAAGVHMNAGRRSTLNEYFRYIGMDLEDPVMMRVVRGFLTINLYTHFQARYCWEHRMKKSAARMHKLEKKLMPEPETKFDDRFYERYAELFARMYMNGVNGLARKGAPEPEDETECTFWLRGLV
jgi:AcrR family transcriptional regulator